VYLGTFVGERYPLLGIVGTGGMGAVYRSVQPIVDRPVAIKLLSAFTGRPDDTRRRRFHQEAKAIARVSHPAIITLYDFGIDNDGTAFMVMELLQGRTLGVEMRRRPIPGREFVGLCLEILDALDTAHANGLVHRDLKPDNVMLLDDPSSPHHRLKVLDFGLAKLVGPGAGPQLTHAGAVFGTPDYMAPEQVDGTAVDLRTDLYAMGIILFEGLAGRLPFARPQALAVLQAQLTEPVPDLPDHIPPPVRNAVMRSLAKSKVDRFGSAAEMAAALRVGLSRPAEVSRPLAAAPGDARKARARVSDALKDTLVLAPKPGREGAPSGGSEGRTPLSSEHLLLRREGDPVEEVDDSETVPLDAATVRAMIEAAKKAQAGGSGGGTR